MSLCFAYSCVEDCRGFIKFSKYYQVSVFPPVLGGGSLLLEHCQCGPVAAGQAILTQFSVATDYSIMTMSQEPESRDLFRCTTSQLHNLGQVIQPLYVSLSWTIKMGVLIVTILQELCEEQISYFMQNP